MDFNEYQEKARKTAIYKDSIIYPALGLCGEAGEVAEKVKKLLRDDDGNLTKERKEAILNELSDVLWYIANLAKDLDIPLNDIAEYNIKKLYSRMERNVIKGDGDNR